VSIVYIPYISRLGLRWEASGRSVEMVEDGVAGKFDSYLDFQADSTTDVRLARTTKNPPVRIRVFLAFHASR